MFDFLTLNHVRAIFLILMLATALGFVLLTGLVLKDKLRTPDFAMTVKLQDKIPKRFDDNLVHIVDLGSMEIQSILILIAIALLPLQKKTKLALVLAYGAGLAITLVGKTFLPQPAPPFLLQRGSQGFSFPSSHVQVDASYPSGHTYRVIFLASVLAGGWLASAKKSVVWLSTALVSTVFAGMVMIGLIVLGKHWTTDVLGGIFLAVSLISGVFFVLK